MKKPSVVKVAAHTRKPPSPPASKPAGLIAIAAPVVPSIDQIMPQMGTTPSIPTPKLASVIRGGVAAMQGTPAMPKAVVTAQRIPKAKGKR
jgi:hypothetical protein